MQLPENPAATSASLPLTVFHADHYRRHNQRRQEHLASLGLDLSGKSVLEVGAGVGDHTSFFLDRGCRVVATEPREESLALLRGRFPQVETHRLDLDAPLAAPGRTFDVVYCYGTLYHLSRPAEALRYLRACCHGLLLLETCVSFSQADSVNLCAEAQGDPSQSVHGMGCRPGRAWLLQQLRALFPHVYVPRTQPSHEEFPLDWRGAPPPNPTGLHRAVFVASSFAISNPLLLDHLPDRQHHHGSPRMRSTRGLFDVIPKPQTPIVVLDIGALTLGRHTEPYSALQRMGLCEVVGFEPVEAECAKLKQIYPEHRFLPYCLGDGGAREFFVTRNAMTSSLIEPDNDLMDRFEYLSELVQVARKEPVQTHRLDDVAELPPDIDYIKADTQGSEHEIFSHARRVLSQPAMVQTEVEFVPLYKSQPLFGAVDALLRGQGFEFHRLVNVSGRRFRGASALPRGVGESQQLWADAVYVKSFMHLERLTPDKLLKLAIMLHVIHGSCDFAAAVLAAHDARAGTRLHPDYLAYLNEMTAE